MSNIVRFLVLAALVVGGVQFVYAQTIWTGPSGRLSDTSITASGPAENVPAPINRNTSGTVNDIQTIKGILTLSGVYTGKVQVDSDVDSDSYQSGIADDLSSVQYFQIDAVTGDGSNPADGCSAAAHAGRMFLDTAQDRLYVCKDGNGWYYADIFPVAPAPTQSGFSS